MLLHNKIKFFCKFAIISLAIGGCIYDVQKPTPKPENFQFVFNNDTAKVTFLIDSSLVKMESLPQWGYLKRFGYQNDKVELYFNFFEDQRDRASQIPDSILVNGTISNYRSLGYKGSIIYRKKIIKNNLYGVLVEYKHENGRVCFFIGEFIENHLSFLVEVFQHGTVEYKTEILNDIVNSLKITVAAD